MRGQVDTKSAAVGAVLGISLLLLAGAASGGRDEAPVIGRFQIACTNTLCFLVDTATGQVWMTGDFDFRTHKLRDPSPALTGEAQDFLGRWIADDPQSNNVGLQIEPDGRAVATDGNSRFEGRWRTFGMRIIVTIDDEVLTGELQPDGRLLLGETSQAGNRITLKRAPQ